MRITPAKLRLLTILGIICMMALLLLTACNSGPEYTALYGYQSSQPDDPTVNEAITIGNSQTVLDEIVTDLNLDSGSFSYELTAATTANQITLSTEGLELEEAITFAEQLELHWQLALRPALDDAGQTELAGLESQMAQLDSELTQLFIEANGVGVPDNEGEFAALDAMTEQINAKQTAFSLVFERITELTRGGAELTLIERPTDTP